MSTFNFPSSNIDSFKYGQLWDNSPYSGVIIISQFKSKSENEKADRVFQMMNRHQGTIIILADFDDLIFSNVIFYINKTFYL